MSGRTTISVTAQPAPWSMRTMPRARDALSDAIIATTASGASVGRDTGALLNDGPNVRVDNSLGRAVVTIAALSRTWCHIPLTRIHRAAIITERTDGRYLD